MKKTASILIFTVLALVSLNANAQKPAPAPTPPMQEVQPADETDVVRITTNLIQLDASVTDKNGKIVTDLKPEDFEIEVNGKPQAITNFSFVSIAPTPPAQPASTNNKAVESALAMPAARLRPDQVKRTIALIFDDLTLTEPYSAIAARSAMRKFVDEQMQPEDLVAIISTGKSFGALQQFTSNKQMLYAAIDNLRYNPTSAFLNVLIDEPQTPPDVTFQRVALARASIGAIGYVVRGMRDLPGRKAVMLMSGGFSISRDDFPEYDATVGSSLERLIDSANRAGVVIYTMDARGLETRGTAADAVSFGMTSQQISRAVFNSMRKVSASQDGLRYLAKEAGGFSIYNTNDLSDGLRRILDDQRSYYLLGYQPDASIFDPANRKFNRLTVKVKRPGLTVRYRSGFFGIKDEDIKFVPRTAQQQITQALISPFAANGVALRLTPLFRNEPKAGSFVRTLVHISANDLTFTSKPGGMREAVFNVVAYTFGDNGNIVDSVGETHTVTLNERLYQRALNSGLVYSLNVPVKKAGGYQLRVAVRDDKARKVGTASQFITIPDIKKDRVALSGISLSSYDPRQERSKEGAQTVAGANGNSTLTQTALRQFRVGHVLQFAYAIYKAKVDKTTGQPRLMTQTKLFRDGKEIFAGSETAYEGKGQTDRERLMAEGGVQLGGLEVGEYVLQVVVTDMLAERKYRTTTNWTDFEVVK
jgi:VWFA-related protein